MGKIRSTLDIVMERTKSLSMTGEEKQKIKRKELGDTVRAWVQRYLDGKMSLREMTSQLASAGEDKAEMLSLLKGELIGNIQIDQDNTRILDALEVAGNISRERAERIIRYEQEELKKKMASLVDSLKIELARQGIRGDAVIPSTAKSKDWQDTVRKAREELVSELSALS